MSVPYRMIVAPRSKRSLATCLATALGMSGAASEAHSAHVQDAIVVTNCADDGPGSLRDAVQGDTSGLPIDLSQLSCGTITLTSGAVNATQSLTLIGPGSTHLTIDGNHGGSVLTEATAGTTLSLHGMTVQNGYVVNGYGGCIFSAGSVVLDDVVVSGCEVAAHGVAQGQIFTGGGITARGDFSATDSRIVDNSLNVSTAAARGGGIWVGGDATLVNSTVSGNSLDIIATTFNYSEFGRAGGMYVAGEALITRSTISNNTAFSVVGITGGGLWVGGFLSMDYSSVSGNSAEAAFLDGLAGGIYDGSSMAIDHSTISGNSASNAGASYAFWDTRLTNTTVSGNTASFIGGIRAYAFASYNSTIAFNVETGLAHCGGVCMFGSSCFVTSSIVSGNVSAGEPSDFGESVLGQLWIVGQNNLIGRVRSDVGLPPDTITGDPLLAPLSDNGGPTLTHALLPGSPAIDTGFLSTAIDFDQRGEGYPRSIGSAPDIGAFEAPLPDQPPTAVNDVYTTLENSTLMVVAPGLLANDSDADGGPLSAVLVDDVAHGSLTLNADGSIVYVPATNFFGTDSFTYTVSDGEATSNIATVTIEVQQVVDTDVVFVNGFD